jgi:electron transport complex protein RnfG
VGSNPAESALTVTKDGGSVAAISGSTITSRAFLGIVNDASAVFAQINNANTTDYED